MVDQTRTAIPPSPEMMGPQLATAVTLGMNYWGALRGHVPLVDGVEVTQSVEVQAVYMHGTCKVIAPLYSHLPRPHPQQWSDQLQSRYHYQTGRNCGYTRL